jgi:hypothetical protein
MDRDQRAVKGSITIRPSGGQPLAGLSAARGLATLQGAFWSLQLLLISNVISEPDLPDCGTYLQLIQSGPCFMGHPTRPVQEGVSKGEEDGHRP